MNVTSVCSVSCPSIDASSRLEDVLLFAVSYEYENTVVSRHPDAICPRKPQNGTSQSVVKLRCMHLIEAFERREKVLNVRFGTGSGGR